VEDADVSYSGLGEVLESTLADISADAVAIGAAVGGASEVAWRGSFNGADIDDRSLFYGASVTKQMIGVLLAGAVIDGTLDASDLISKWLPELSGQTGSVQLAHLIHHTSGLADVMEFSEGDPRSNADVINRFRRLKPATHATPGTMYCYNNAGYVLLAESLSRSLDQPITDLAATALFTPLALTHTQLGGLPIVVPDCPEPPGTIGDGGLWVSIHDLLRWLQACNAQALGGDVHRLAETASHLTDGSPLDYAWGIRITPAPYGRVISHGGSWALWQSKTVRIPERHVAVAVLSLGATADSVSQAGTRLASALALQ